MKRMVKGMSREEKQSMMAKMMDEFFASMTSEEKKDLMKQMMPKMMEKMMEGMTVKDKQELMGSMMPAMMSQMFGGEGGMPSMMMQTMKGMMGGEKKGEEGEFPRMPVMETQEDFKPWEFCPCRKLCEEGFKKKSKS
ncbi:MAG: hypothetical protein H3Z53_00455 [archaeon]|nr:hypothetical protein [archaeon]MCP8321900.1 hypothetical protein [archaeon]